MANTAHENAKPHKVAVIIPTYKARDHILNVLERVGKDVTRIYVVDDCCPDGSGDLVQTQCIDPRVKVITHAQNKGVGGAVMTGYQAAIADGMEILVKIDSDGQMDPGILTNFVSPIAQGEADYSKGNRFYNLEMIYTMPKFRIIGNAILSLMSKLSSGYWNLFDPTNGYTAIHYSVAKKLPFHKISERYFFECDILFRLNTLRAVVIDIPMDAKYGNEASNLKISEIIGEFFLKHLSNFFKRVFYNYYLRDMSLASIELPIGVSLLSFGMGFGAYQWAYAAQSGIPTSAGTVMLAALPTLMGLQLVLAFLAYDIASVPRPSINRF
jgi:glycosyltransferase involved in cell wall biosynthesis